MNIRKMEDSSVNLNVVIIKHSGAFYNYNKIKNFYDIPLGVVAKLEAPTPLLRGRHAEIKYRFRHTKGHMLYLLYISKIDRYTISGKTGFKRCGEVDAPIVDFDSPLGKRERKKLKEKRDVKENS